MKAQQLELEEIAYRNVCAMCNSPLFLSWNGQLDTFEISCGQNREHKGYIRLKSLYQKWQAGESLPVEVAQAMEHKYGGKGKKE